MDKIKQFVIAVYVDNQSGVLTRVTSMFTRRGFNIDTLTVGETEEPAYSRITISLSGDGYAREQLINQMRKLYNVKKVEVLEESPVIRINPEFRMFVPYAPVKLQVGTSPVLQNARTYGFFGDKLAPEEAKWACEEQKISSGIRWTVKLAKKDFFEEDVPFRLAVTKEGEGISRWEKGDRYYDRLIFGRFSPDSYVFVIPRELKER